MKRFDKFKVGDGVFWIKDAKVENQPLGLGVVFRVDKEYGYCLEFIGKNGTMDRRAHFNDSELRSASSLEKAMK